MEKTVKNKSEFPEEETLSLGDVPDWMEKSTTFGYPTPELMVRWAQANVFLGVMQFSLAPWDFGPEANRICRKQPGCTWNLFLSPEIRPRSPAKRRSGHPAGFLAGPNFRRSPDL